MYENVAAKSLQSRVPLVGKVPIIADVLPFQATTYTPVAIYVGRIRGADALGALGVQAVWVVVLTFASWAMWHRALHRVVVQGG